MRTSHKAGNTGRRGGAFTLLELMIAIAIFSMVMVSIYATWSAILRASQTAQKAAAEAQRSRVAMKAIGESMGATEMFLQNIRYYSFMSDTAGDFAAVSFVSHLPPSFPGSGMFGAQAVRRVTFNVEQGKSGKNELILRQSPFLEPPDATAEPYSIILAPSVRQFRLFFWETNTSEWVEEWLWTNRLPRMVRVELALGDPARGPLRPEDVAIKTVFLSSGAIPREAQVPANRGGAVGQPGNVRPPQTR
jgi:prepilin-type N-terminal cleavage/methylation domain-containing protein